MAMKFFAASFLTILTFAGVAHAEQSYTLTIKDHKFSPETLEVPAGERIKINVVNQDATPEEFESHDLKREKIINGNSTGVILVGPLQPGTYGFFGEFHEATAKGSLVVK